MPDRSAESAAPPKISASTDLKAGCAQDASSSWAKALPEKRDRIAALKALRHPKTRPGL